MVVRLKRAKLKYINLKGTPDNEGNIIVVKPFNGIPNFETGKIDYSVKKNDWFHIEDSLDNQGKYVGGGVKDKGILKIYQYHPDIDQISFDHMIGLLSKGMVSDENARRINSGLEPLLESERSSLLTEYKTQLLENYKHSLDKEFEWFGGIGGDVIQSEGMELNIGKRHEKIWKSKVLWEAERHGLYTTGKGEEGFTMIGNLMRDKVTAANIVDWNKREQIFNTKSIPLDISINGKDTFRVTIFEDHIPDKDKYPDFWYETEITNADGSKTTLKLPYESQTDGTIYIRQDVWDQIAKGSGIPTDEGIAPDIIATSGMLKPFVASKLDTGILLGKAAGRRVSNKMNEFMLENDLDIIFMRSASKLTGGIRPSKYDYIDGKYVALGD